jgi:site-specific DNA recombinase
LSRSEDKAVPRQVRAGTYCRVSSRIQEEEGTSLETQSASTADYARTHGYSLDPRCCFQDVFSGWFLRERTGLSDLRQAIRKGQIDVVVVHALDRLSRKQAHVAILMDEAEQAGVRFEFVTESFETGAVGEFIRQAKAFAAEVEREKIRERVIRGRAARVKNGKPLTGPCPALRFYILGGRSTRFC